MPKFKPGNIVARVVLGKSWRERNNTDYLYAEIGRYLSKPYPQAHCGRASDDDDDDDGSSIISSSSTATFDDLPGTGRTLDVYIFQPMGRRIERLAMRFTIASLHPARIAQYLKAIVPIYYEYPLDDSTTLHNAIAQRCSWSRNGTTAVAGLKGLVKQTQSNSVDRSAAALAALIRVSLEPEPGRRAIFFQVSRIEPIFHLETLVRSHPDKKWFLFLVKLGREALVAIRVPLIQESFDPRLGQEVSQIRPSPEAASSLRQRLIRVLKVYSLSGLVSLDDTIGEACAICAEAASTCISEFARGDAYMHILDTVYFTVIFILRSIYELANLARITNSKHIYMVLRTLACLMDIIVAIAIRSVVFVDVDTKYMLLPSSLAVISDNLMSDFVIPRRYREENKLWRIHYIESLVEAAKQRTRRLLRSFDALEFEVRWCTSQSKNCTTQLKIIADPFWISPSYFGDEWVKCWMITQERARRVRVQANSLTEEFRKARRLALWCWIEYQIGCTSRHKWGQYFRSNMDWDWDLGTCMRRLFEVEPTRERQPRAAQCSPVPNSDIDMDAEQGTTWRLEAQGSLPKQVQIAYKTESGETQYMSFAPTCPSPRHYPTSERSCAGFSGDESLEPTFVQLDLGYRKAISCEEPEVEDLATSASSSDASPPEACDEIPVESYYGSEGKEPTYDVGVDGVRVGGVDSMSICSLD